MSQSQIIFLIFGIIIGGFLVWLILKNRIQSRNQPTHYKNTTTAQKKILEYLKSHSKITNNDVQKLLSVSDATASRHLELLEKKGKLVQRGEVGRGVFYES